MAGNIFTNLGGRDQKNSTKLIKLRRGININREPYDLWGNEDCMVKCGGRHRPKYVPSVLPAIVPPPEGASYNPPLNSYKRYINDIATEEQQSLAMEDRLERIIESGGDSLAYSSGLHTEGFFGGFHLMSGESKNEIENNSQATEEELINTSKLPKRKTIKDKRRKKMFKQMEIEKRKVKDLTKKKCQQLDRVKSLGLTVDTQLKDHQQKILLRRKEKTVKKLTQRKRLGRGKFEPYMEPALAVLELPKSLRQLTPAGSIIQERLKSLQKRNILPIGGDKQQQKLKNRLKFKFVEKRCVKQITTTSRVI